MQRVHDAFRGTNVAVLAISIDGTGAQAVKPVMVEGQFTFTAPIDQDMNVARKFGVRAVPMTYVIDRGGAVVAQGFGPVDFDAPAFSNFIKAVAARGS